MKDTHQGQEQPMSDAQRKRVIAELLREWLRLRHEQEIARRKLNDLVPDGTELLIDGRLLRWKWTDMTGVGFAPVLVLPTREDTTP